MSGEIERQPVKRLDQALTIWEQACFLLETENRIGRGLGLQTTFPLVDPLLHYSEFRSHLLKSAEAGSQFDSGKFKGTNKAIQDILGTVMNIPENLYGWNKYSRRVYSLSEDITLQLLNTNLDGVLWSDVRFPFKSYGMQLEAPVSLGDHYRPDFILVNELNIDSCEAVSFSLFSNKLDELYLLPEKEKRFFANMIARRRWMRAYRKFVELSEQPTLNDFPYLLMEKSKLDFPVTDSRAAFNRLGLSATPEQEESFRQVSQLIVGFCLYLKQLPVGSTHQSEWVPVPSSPDLTAITNEAEVCYITSTHPLAEKLRNDEPGKPGRGGYEMSWHHRSGYWSREKGKGGDPNAPKVIWHPPTEVRRDRKPSGDSIPGGTQTNVI